MRNLTTILPSLGKTTFSLLLALTTTACPGNLDEMAAEEAVDSHELALNESALMATSADDMEGATTNAAAVAARAEARAKARYLPAGCATITRQENVVTHVLNGCTGPRGLRQLTGTLTVTFSDVATGVQIDMASKDLKVNQAIMDVASKGLLTNNGATKTLTISSAGNGVGPRGNKFVRTGSFTLVADPATECLSLDGAWQLSVGTVARSTTITGVKVCKNSCPSAGTISHTGFRGRNVTVTFDGSTEANWKTSLGRDGSVQMQCAAMAK
jgi:hypothetical protein